MKNKIKIFAALFCAAVILLNINGCKKTEDTFQTVDKTGSVVPNVSPQRLAELRAEVEAHPEYLRMMIPINQVREGYYADLAGNRITSLPNNFVYQCADAGDLDYPPTTTLISTSYDYNCNAGYNLIIKWQISCSFNIVPGTGSAITRGRIRIKNFSGTTLYSNLSLAASSITYIGDDPSTGNANKIYEIVYQTGFIGFSYFGSATNYMENSVVGVTDCVDLPTVAAPYTTTSGATFDITQPCNRVDPVRPHAYSASAPSVGDVESFGLLLYFNLCPAPSNYADRQQVQLRYVGSGSTDVWRDITPIYGTTGAPGELNPFNVTTDHGTIGGLDLYQIPTRDLYLGTHGPYEVRYRNVMYPLGSGCTGPWSNTISIGY